MQDILVPKRALISVSDKTGLIPFAQGLVEQGIEILSTGGTAKTLSDNGINVVPVSEITAFPEIMGGRVKTLHPRIHGGILARRGIDEAVMQEYGIPAIDLVVINLYPFRQTIAQSGTTFDDAIEQIDIGGPAMVRAAAKNNADVAVIVNPNRYEAVLGELTAAGISRATRLNLATEAFGHTSEYDSAIHQYLSEQSTKVSESEPELPSSLIINAKRTSTLRYGENPHQRAALYCDSQPEPGTLTRARQLQGKELSWNNLNDANAALDCVRAFDSNACVIVKHANPCGVALHGDSLIAYERAYECDPVSAFGGIIAFNRPLEANTAQKMVEQQFIEVVLAPSLSNEAKAVFATKSNIRVLETDDVIPSEHDLDVRRISGGWLVQDADNGEISEEDLRVVTEETPSEAQIRDMLMAWKVVKFVKSNAIVYVKDNATIGIGAGQMSRVHSAQIAGIKAQESGLTIKGAVMASDAFFPFRDGIDTAAERGIKAIIQPGNSMRDEEVIAAANEHGIAMVFTGMRHFRH